MTKYEEIIENIKRLDENRAEMMEEEIDIMIHKLKFLPTDSFPNVVILVQNNIFEPLYNPTLEEKIKIAGGTLIKSISQDPQVIIIIQQTEDLYQILPSYLTELKNQKTRAILENKVFIINKETFHKEDEQYLQDVEILAEIIQPKYFHFGHDGQEWVKFNLQ